MVSIVLPADPHLTLGSKDQTSTFSEHGHVANQIKGNHECTNMVANILPADSQCPHTLGMRSIGQNSFFSEHGLVAYYNLLESQI